MRLSPAKSYLHIGDVAKLVGISPTVLRLWESLGLVRPKRTRSRYRLYTPEDIKVLKRARYLRKVRGMNAQSIALLLKGQGLLPPARTPEATPVGIRLRNLRLRRHLALAAVSKATGISVSFLSAVERGQMSASVGTLRKLARFYEVSILSLFNPSDANPHRVRPAERKMLDAGEGVRMELLAWGNTVMEPHLFRVAPGAGSGEAYAHEGEEFLFLLRGQLDISLDDGESFKLRPGDSFYFESSTPHRWSNPGQEETWILWVNTPPTF
ncbi:MAG: cupin domain-containing protein [Terriglobia bacterium]